MSTATQTYRRQPNAREVLAQVETKSDIKLPDHAPTLAELAATLEDALNRYVIAASLMTNTTAGAIAHALSERWVLLRPYIVEKVCFVRSQRDNERK